MRYESIFYTLHFYRLNAFQTRSLHIDASVFFPICDLVLTSEVTFSKGFGAQTTDANLCQKKKSELGQVNTFK
jgi:hypothetical protein